MTTNLAVDLRGVWKRFYLRRQWTFQEAVADFLHLGRGGVVNSFWALEDLNLAVKKGETLGVVGPNGAGKSTLLKILAGMMGPTRGEVKMWGQVAPLLSLNTGLAMHLTGRENIFLNGAVMGQSRAQISKQLPKILEFADLGDFIDQPIKIYSSGMYARLVFAMVTFVPFDTLLIDELLAVGDMAFQERCYQKLHQFQKQGKTIIMVSHNGEEMLKFCDRVLRLDRGRTVACGDPDKTLRLYWRAKRASQKLQRH